MAKLGVMPWMVRRRSWMLNTLSQHRRVGRNHNMAKMGDRRFGTNNNVALTGDVVTISQNNEVKTERTVRCVASETSH